jgi:hypothetical protein
MCYADFRCEGSSTRFKYDKGDYEAMKDALGKVDWEVELDGKSVDQCWTFFSQTLSDNMSKYIPTSVSKGNSKFKPLWMCREAMGKVKRKHSSWARYTLTRQYSDYVCFARARNEATAAVRGAKKEFERKLAEEVKQNPKAFWKYVSSKTKSRSGVSDLERGDGSMTTSNKDKAEVLNQFFSSVFTREDIDNVPSLGDRYEGEVLSDLKVTEEAVLKKLIKLKSSKSAGPDGLHPRVLKEVANQIKTPLRIIFQMSLDQGVVPQEWKSAHVSAIFKKGSKKAAGNYRPVSLTAVICKVLESIIRDSLVSHMGNQGMFSDEQYGFTEGRSCMLQLLVVLEEWSEIIDSGGAVDVVYLDFSKAFDTVPHVRLLEKLQAYGIKGKIRDWIRSFLEHRRQRVVIGGECSDWAEVLSGIPQGSVLGPILFIVFINDLPDSVKCMSKLFADDTKVYTQVATDEDRARLQQDLDSLSQWSDTWLLRFNADKCKVLHFGSSNPGYQYTMGEAGKEIVLKVVQEEKDLGVTFDPTLKFSVHCNAIANKASSVVGAIKRSFDFMDQSMFKMLYKALVRPHLEYANSVWNPRLKKDIELLERVQRRATRIVPELKGLSYPERLKILNLPTLVYRRKRGDLIEVFKLLRGLENIDATRFFTPAPYAATRGHELKLFKQHSKLAVKQHSFSHRVVNDWNALPSSVIQSMTMNEFKSALDRHWNDLPIKYQYKFNW